LLLLRRTNDRAAGSSGFGGIGALRAVGGWMPLVQTYALFGFSYILMTSFLVARLHDDAGFTVGQVSAVVTINGVASIISGVLLGRLADRFGERQVLIWSFAISAVATLICLTSNFPIVVGAAFMLSVWTTGVPAVVASYVIRRTSVSTYGPAFSAMTFAFGITQAVSPQVGGLIADAFGSFTLVFLLSALTRAAGFVTATRLPRAVLPPERASGPLPHTDVAASGAAGVSEPPRIRFNEDAAD
ncbi:MAG: MFS transporter, partial [Dehalococcoidia bacterium]